MDSAATVCPVLDPNLLRLFSLGRYRRLGLSQDIQELKRNPAPCALPLLRPHTIELLLFYTHMWGRGEGRNLQ
jgi:hypothetical protein